MSYSEKKAYRLNFTIYVHGDYRYLSSLQSRIRRYIEKTVSKKKLVRITSSFTDRLIS